MRVFTPQELAREAGNKYLGVLVAARYGRELNAIPRDAVPAGAEKKLTTQSLEALAAGSIAFDLARRRGRRI
jgi:DNA-directed RNA polymerase omega subunit